jgi:formylglycine-generating enzyme required for sulfatase activity
MPRLRHLFLSIGVAVAIIACGRTPSGNEVAATPTRTPSPAPATKPAPAPDRVRMAPQWQSRVPEIAAAQVAQTLRQANDALARGQLERGSSPGPGALELYLAVLAVAPEDAAAQAGVQSSLDALFERGRLAMRAGRQDEAERIEVIARSLLAEHPDLDTYRAYLRQARVAERWVDKANIAGKAGRITAPPGDSVRDYLERAERAFPDYGPAAEAARRWNRVLLEKAWQAAQAEDFASADTRLRESAQLRPGSPEARVMELRVIELRQARTDAVLAAGNEAVDTQRLVMAGAELRHAARIAAQPAGVDALRKRIYVARHYGPFKPGQVFVEKLAGGQPAPEMVVVPFGSFTMGSPEDDPQGQDNERPAREVHFARGFAIARNETTVADFRRFIAASHYQTWATRAGHSTVYDEKGGVFSEHEGVDWRRDHVGRIAAPTLPVVHVTHADAQAYANWLSDQTGHRYRLPSEAEFEYVLRAGSKDTYPWGPGPPKRIVGNLPGDGDLSRLGRRWGNPIPGYRDAFWGPSPARIFPVERFGTYDMIGNVSEWTLDCWHDSYQRAPVDGSAWVNPGCPSRVVRGASWGSSLDQARSASRLPMDNDTSTARLGFRVVREI